MRFPLAYYLLLIYLTVMFKPVIPIISDAYSHTFGEAIHLATVHATYGSNHLAHALAATGTENNTRSQGYTNPGENFEVHISASGCLYVFYLARTNNSYAVTGIRNLSTIFLSKIVPPPKV